MPSSVTMGKGQGQFKMEDYHMSAELGCVMKTPLTKLPPYFDPWQEVIDVLPQKFDEKTLRTAIEKLPVLDQSRLKGNHQLYLAHLQLAYMASGYIWMNGDLGVPEYLPKGVAIPLRDVSIRLGVKPVISHLDVSLVNWTLIDPDGLIELDNMKCVCGMPGEDQGNYFCLVVCLVEMKFGKCVRPIIETMNLLQKAQRNGNQRLGRNDETAMVQYFEEIAESMQDMKAAIAKMHDGLLPHRFFNDVRPFFAGWGGAHNPLPNGIIFEGVSETPITMMGGSAAQSTTLQAVDAFFGVKHNESQTEFLLAMRDFMPPGHAKLLRDIESLPIQLGQYVRTVASQFVRDAHDKALTSVADFRSYHLGIVSKYVVRPSKIANEDKHNSLDDRGTGGAKAIPFLRKIRDDMKARFVRTLPPSSIQTGTSVYLPVATAFLVTAAVSLYMCTNRLFALER